MSLPYERVPRDEVEISERRNSQSVSVPIDSPVSADATTNPVGGEFPSAQLDGMTSVKIIQLGLGTKLIHVNLDWTIEEFKQHVFPEDVSKNKNIRVIFSGKLLKNEEHLANCGVKENSFLHIAISDTQPLQHHAAVAEAEQGEAGPAGAEFGVHGQQDLEAMMAEQARYEQYAATNQGTLGDFIVGFAMGFVIGMIMVIWIWQPRLSKRQKAGILCGISFHLLLSYFNANKNGSHADSTGSSSSGDSQPISNHGGN